MFFAKPLQRSNLCASHRQRRWLTHGELEEQEYILFALTDLDCGLGHGGHSHAGAVLLTEEILERVPGHLTGRPPAMRRSRLATPA